MPTYSPNPEPIKTKPDFRSVGFTDNAYFYPRTELGIAMFAAFNNVRPDQLPEAMKYYPNASMKSAWDRVADAAVENILPPKVWDVLHSVVNFANCNHTEMRTVSGDEALAALGEEAQAALAAITALRSSEQETAA